MKSSTKLVALAVGSSALILSAVLWVAGDSDPTPDLPVVGHNPHGQQDEARLPAELVTPPVLPSGREDVDVQDNRPRAPDGRLILTDFPPEYGQLVVESSLEPEDIEAIYGHLSDEEIVTLIQERSIEKLRMSHEIWKERRSNGESFLIRLQPMTNEAGEVVRGADGEVLWNAPKLMGTSSSPLAQTGSSELIDGTPHMHFDYLDPSRYPEYYRIRDEFGGILHLYQRRDVGPLPEMHITHEDLWPEGYPGE